jgi:hypothetical protein
MGRGKAHFNVGSRPLTANSCNANGGVTGLRRRSTARTSGDAAESFLPVVMSNAGCCRSGDIASQDVTATKTSCGRDMWVDASSTKAEVATVDEVPFREAEIRVDWDSVQVSPCMPALKTEQACALQ